MPRGRREDHHHPPDCSLPARADSRRRVDGILQLARDRPSADHALCLARSNLWWHAAVCMAGSAAEENLQQPSARAALQRLGGIALAKSADIFRLRKGSGAKGISADVGIVSAVGAPCSIVDVI